MRLMSHLGQIQESLPAGPGSDRDRQRAERIMSVNGNTALLVTLKPVLRSHIGGVRVGREYMYDETWGGTMLHGGRKRGKVRLPGRSERNYLRGYPSTWWCGTGGSKEWTYPSVLTHRQVLQGLMMLASMMT